MATSNYEPKKKKKKKMEKQAVVDVPEDLIAQILLRVPARYLSQLRWACKYWYNLITNDPSFIKLHLEHSDQVIADNISILLLDRRRNILQVNHIQGDTVSSPIWETKSLGFRLWGSSCNGLFCVQMLKLNVICLWNPCTDELRTIPNSLLKIEDDKDFFQITYGLGYCSNIDDYKVIRKITKITSFGTSSGSLEIYSLRTNSWKTVYNGDDPCNYYCGWSHGVGVHLNGSLYFSVVDHNVVCFDVEKEKYRQLSMPKWSATHTILDAIGELQGCLCLFSVDLNVVEVWMTKDCGWTKENWIKSFTITNPMVHEILTWGLCTYKYTSPVKFNKNGEILLTHIRNSELFWYNPKADKTRQVAEVPNSWFQAETYTDTLVSINPSVYMC